MDSVAWYGFLCTDINAAAKYNATKEGTDFLAL
jgi:hypothetical protein